MFVIAPRPADVSLLEHDLASGGVSTIHVRGGLPGSSVDTGFADLTIRWRSGHVTRQVTVREARPVNGPEARDTDLTVVPAGEVGRLRSTFPQLKVEALPEAERAGFSLAILGAELYGWVIWLGVLPMVATFALLVNGPEPWRATRWAWFWLFAVIPPVGAIAYLVLGGPTGLSPRPRMGALRLTGGWAFLLQLLLGSATAATLFTA